MAHALRHFYVLAIKLVAIESQEGNGMNEDVFSGKWREMRGTLRSWWGRLSDDDFERIGGEKDKLVGLVQERYGQTREQAETEVDRRLSEYGSSSAGIGSNLRSRVDELGSSVSSKAAEAAGAMSNRVQSARSYLQERNLDDLTGEIVAWVRQYPIQACLIGIGLGYLIARSFGGGDRSHYE
jgi:uncharacterized protein YjbJ (UPF0337 family)